jgi:hypothetical protein
VRLNITTTFFSAFELHGFYFVTIFFVEGASRGLAYDLGNATSEELMVLWCLGNAPPTKAGALSESRNGTAQGWSAAQCDCMAIASTIKPVTIGAV